MLRIALVLIALVAIPQAAHAKDFLGELHNAVKRGPDGGTTFFLYLTSGKKVEVRGEDYDEFDLTKQNDIPLWLELRRTKGKVRGNTLINLMNAKYSQVRYEKVDGQWLYEFDIYY